MGNLCFGASASDATTDKQETSNLKNPAAAAEPHTELGKREHAHAHKDKHGQLVSDGDGHRVFDNAYYAAREEAEAKAQLMHKESAAADAAYKSGAKGDAHKHSVASKQHRHDMEQANLRAAAMILEPQGWKTSRKLDLHGLHVKEAEHAVEDFLKAYTSGVVEIVTGAGHHSKGGESHAKIKPAIESLLKNHKIRHELEHGAGAFKCHL